MKLKFELEVDLEYAMLNNDSDPFVNFTSSDYKEYVQDKLLSCVEEISGDCGADIVIKNEKGVVIN